MKLRKLIERKSVVAERVNLEAARMPDARDLFLQARLRREQAEAGVFVDEASTSHSDIYGDDDQDGYLEVTPDGR